MLDAFDGPILVPDAGRLDSALDSINIHPEHTLLGMVKFPE
jgi:hypothetical protein